MARDQLWETNDLSPALETWLIWASGNFLQSKKGPEAPYKFNKNSLHFDI